MNQVFVDDRQLVLRASDLIGEGGEAEVYRIDPAVALKLYKSPSHPQFAGKSAQACTLRQAACQRLERLQGKLRQFPTGLPSRVIVPQKLAFDTRDSRARIIGYTMALVKNAHSLHEFANRTFRESGGIDQNAVVSIFKDLHDTLTRLHDAQIVIGDFNQLNVLVEGTSAYLVDADSMQFGPFLSTTYCPRYVDPLICNPTASKPEMVSPHCPDTDWYAFAILFFECLLFVHPYGGVYKPFDPSHRLCPEERPLRRVSVFHKEVQYPAAGLPLNILPDAIAEFFIDLIERDVRKPFPRRFLESLKFDKGIGRLQAAVVAPAIVASGATARRVFATEGLILKVTHQGRRLRYVYYQDGLFLREDDSVVLRGALDRDLSFCIHKDATLVSLSGRTFLLNPAAEPQAVAAERFRGRQAVIAANGEHYCFVDNGQLYLGSSAGLRQIAEVLSQQTMIFLGPAFGFGLWQAGEFRRAFLFETQNTSVARIPVDIAPVLGKLVDVSCFFSANALWLIVTSQELRRLVRHCALIDRNGEVLACALADDGDDSWLGATAGKCAASFPLASGLTLEALLVATAAGVVQIERAGDRLVQTRTYSGTRGLVSPEHNLLFGVEGLFAWTSHEIKVITT